MDALPSPVEKYPLALDIRSKFPVCSHLRVADIMTKGCPFAADFTFCHSFTSRISITEGIIPQRPKDATNQEK